MNDRLSNDDIAQYYLANAYHLRMIQDALRNRQSLPPYLVRSFENSQQTLQSTLQSLLQVASTRGISEHNLQAWNRPPIGYQPGFHNNSTNYNSNNQNSHNNNESMYGNYITNDDNEDNENNHYGENLQRLYTEYNKVPNNAQNIITNNAIQDGNEMVNFHGESNMGRYYKRSTYNALRAKKNPYTRRNIQPQNVRFYRAKKTRRARARRGGRERRA